MQLGSLGSPTGSSSSTALPSATAAAAATSSSGSEGASTPAESTLDVSIYHSILMSYFLSKNFASLKILYFCFREPLHWQLWKASNPGLPNMPSMPSPTATRLLKLLNYLIKNLFVIVTKHKLAIVVNKEFKR